MTRRLGRSFNALVGAQLFGAFNDNLFKQLILFLAASMLFPGEDKQGLAFAVFALPFVLFSGMAGDLSEKFQKRSIIVRMKFAEIAIMVLGAFALASLDWGFMLAVLAIMGLQSAFFGPSKYGVIPEVVEPPQLVRANGVIAMTTFLGVLLGQALAGPLLDGFGDRLWIPGAFCTGFAVLGTVIALRMGPTPPQKPELPLPRQPFGSLFSTITELRGAQADGRTGLFRVVLLYSFFWFNGGVVQQAIVGLGEPAYLDIGEGEKTLLSLLLVTLAVSIIVGSVIAPRLATTVPLGKLTTRGAVGMVLGQAGLLLIGPVFDRAGGGLYVAHALMVVIGVAGACFVVPIQSYLQDAPPPGMRGKTFAVNNFMNFLFIFFGGVYYLVLRGPQVGLELSPALTETLAGALMLGWLLLNRRAVAEMNAGLGQRATSAAEC